jgi:hypothetical protein
MPEYKDGRFFDDEGNDMSFSCVVCNVALPQGNSSGLCDEHKYDEQIEQELISKGVQAFWTEMHRQAEVEQFGPCVMESIDKIDGYVNPAAIVKAILKAVGTKGISE